MEIDSYQQGDVHVLRALLYEVLMLLDRAYLKMISMEEGRSREVFNNHVSKFMNLVATHAKEQHSVQYYADKLCITPNYLNEMITSTMGFSAKQYIQGKVMEEAKRLLVYTDFPIADIAFELCFQRFLILSVASDSIREKLRYCIVKHTNRKKCYFYLSFYCIAFLAFLYFRIR